MSITSIISLNQLISWFEDFQENHYFLKDFGFGEPYDIGTSRQMNFPYMWVTMNEDSNIQTASNNKSAIPDISFSIMFMDKINNQPNYLDTNGFQSDNSQEILSDTLQCVQDLIVYIQQNWQQYGVLISQDVSFYPAVDETTDKATGVVARFVLRTRQVNCVIPENPATIVIQPTQATYSTLLTCESLDTCSTFQTYAYTGGTFISGSSEVTLTSLNGNTLTITGFTGGAAGSSGTSGTSGVNGSNGSSGTSGAQGSSGSSGTSGINGTNGSSGTSGVNGSSGASGTNGTDGSSGTSGAQGTNGTDGSSGTSGAQGTNGSSGTSGINGTDGSSGTSGAQGISGATGSNGTSGTDGSSGTSGVGTNGTSGTSGAAGSSGTSGTGGGGGGGDLTIGTTPISGGTVGQILFEGSGNVLQEDSKLFWDNTNKGLGIGATPSSAVTLDVRAYSDSINDSAFRVRNSGDTANLINVINDGEVRIGLNAGGISPVGYGQTYIGKDAGKLNQYTSWNTTIGELANAESTTGGSSVFIGYKAGLGIYPQGNTIIGYEAALSGTNINGAVVVGGGGLKNQTGYDFDSVYIGNGAGAYLVGGMNPPKASGDTDSNVLIGADTRRIGQTDYNSIIIGATAKGLGTNSSVIGNSTTTLFKLWGAGLFQNVTAPTSAVTDNFHFYSNDIVAGNAAPHFRTEAGNTIKLYTEAAVTTPQGISTALTNLGLLSASTITQGMDISVALGSETTNISAASNLITIYAPYAFTITEVSCSLTTSGSTLTTFDVNKNNVSIFSTNPTIDANENSTGTAATPSVLSTTAVAKYDKITFDIDTAGTNAKGAKVYIVGTRAI
jgi:hypothetical protein